MKKFISLIAVFTLAISSYAQLVSSTSSSLINKPTEKRSMWMFRLGLGSNNFAGDDFKEVGSKFGYFFGFEYNREMGHRGAYYGADFALASRGYKIDEDGYTETYAAHNIHISPVIFGWKVPVASQFTIDPHIGMFVSCDYAGNVKTEYDDYDEYDEDLKIADIEDYNRFDVGIKFGVGVWFKNTYNLDFTYQRGFLAPNTDFDGGQSNFMVRLGYAF